MSLTWTVVATTRAHGVHPASIALSQLIVKAGCATMQHVRHQLARTQCSMARNLMLIAVVPIVVPARLAKGANTLQIVLDTKRRAHFAAELGKKHTELAPP